MIAFSARGTKPLEAGLAARPWPFLTAVDRPTCLVAESILISRGGGVSADVGRGLVALPQCAIATGGTTFALSPDRVARHRLDADLRLENCTVASETTFVSLGPWRGAEPGPDRPWLVSTQKCAFFGSYVRTGRESILLRADPESLAHGSLFWQSAGDAFEVSTFAAASDSPRAETRRPDVLGQWVELWGRRHVVGASGPRLPSGLPNYRLIARLRPGNVEPGDLAIDPSFPADPPPRDLGVNLTRLGVTPTTRPGRRR